MTITATPHGRPAYDALTRAVAAAKAGDPLAPVSVVVPTEPLGVAARRWLAQHGNDGQPGAAGLTFLTLYRLAELLAGPQFAKAGRRPATTPILVGALRGALAERPGRFEQVADHPTTAQTLASASRELRTLDEPTRTSLAGRPITDDLLALHTTAWRTLADDYYDEIDLQDAAIRLLRTGQLPPVVLFLPRELSPGAQAFVAALAAAGSVDVVLGLTDPAIDDRLVASIQQALPGEPPVVPPPATALLADRVVCTTDADDEVRATVTAVAERLRAGTPGHRIAIVHGSATPYARTLHEHLGDAGITYYGRGVRPATESRYGRAVRGLLALPDRDLRRADVITWLEDAPVTDAWALRWDRMSRKAGVVAGADWDTRLAAFVDKRRADARESALSADPEVRATAEWADADADTTTELRDFMLLLRADLAAVDTATDWPALSQRLTVLWTRLFGNALGDTDDVRIHAKIRDLLAELSGLTAIGVPPSRHTVREILELELANDLRRIGTIGTGVLVGSLADAAGQDFDAVYILGLAEGVTPAISADDPLLPESVRVATGGVLPTWRDRQNLAQRDLLAVLAGSAWTQLSFPRGDLRSGTSRVPSRWLLPTLQAQLGDVQATDWQHAAAAHPNDAVEVRASYDAGIRSTSPVTPAGYAHRRAIADHTSVDPLPVAIARDRAEGRFTPFTGLVGDQADRRPLGSSATALQAFFACPHHYFVRYLLNVRELDDPDEVVEMSAIDQGTLQHAILEQLVKEAVAAQALDFGQAWPIRWVERLDDVIDEHFARAERQAAIGLRTPWQKIKRRMRADLRRWVAADNALRAEGGWKPLAAEVPFDDLAVPLPDGRTMRMRGSIDRVDVDRAGNLHVLDYKTGSAKKYKKLTADNPLDHGRFLQLPLYALAARAAKLGASDTAIRADFWFISKVGDNKQHGYDVSDEILQATSAAFAVVADSHRDGLFPPRPAAHSNGYACVTCTVDGLDERMAPAVFDTLRADPRLAAYGQVIADV